VALLATQIPEDIDDDALRPINAFVIRTVQVLLVGGDADGIALDFVADYSGHKHVQTEILVLLPEQAISLEVQVC
jgi:hypothetical protein